MSSMRHEARLNQLDKKIESQDEKIKDLLCIIEGIQKNLESAVKPSPKKRQHTR